MNAAKSKWKPWHKWMMGICIVVLIIVIFATNQGEKIQAKEIADKAVFNIPDLINKDSSYIIKKIGNPVSNLAASDPQKTLDIGNELNFAKGRYFLDVFFDAKTGLADSFRFTDSSADINDYKSILPDGNISEDARDYSIKPIKKMNGKYTGVNITISK